MLSMVSLDLEQSLQKAFNLAADYVGIAPPEVSISRDFDIDRLIGPNVTALTALFDQGVLGRDEFRQILVQGEILPSAGEEQSAEAEAQEGDSNPSTDQMERFIQALTE